MAAGVYGAQALGRLRAVADHVAETDDPVDAVDGEGVHFTMNRSGLTKVLPCDTVIEAYDRVVVFAKSDAVREVDTFFK